LVIKESLNYPYEGYFWIINDEVIGVTSEVPHYNYDYALNGKTHKNTWTKFSKDYLVDGKEVVWDYFPRGRVMIDPNYDLTTEKFTDYSCLVFLDKCINNNKFKRLIVDYYNLDLNTIPHINWMMLNERAGIEHYTCHNCRN
jgi:hypothetical protein